MVLESGADALFLAILWFCERGVSYARGRINNGDLCDSWMKGNGRNKERDLIFDF